MSFDWKQNHLAIGHDVGVIAQELEEILEAVRTGGYGQKQVNYEKDYTIID